MTLIKSISGIRGTVGGAPGENLTPPDIVKFAAAYAAWLKERTGKTRLKVVTGRDARISGDMVASLVEGALAGCGADVVSLGLATTPTVEMAVVAEKADGGIIITASHNPRQWNALKLLDARGEFLSDAQGKRVLEIAESNAFAFVPVDELGKRRKRAFGEAHIEAVLNLPLVDAAAVRKAGFRVVVDAVNSVGGIVIPELLRRLGVDVVELNCTPDGNFAHNPEPLPENLTEISERVVREKADLGIVVDPDVDRLALVCEKGEVFGEEYTLVSVADYVLSHTPGTAVSNLSSSRALRDVTRARGGAYHAAAVGEVNVVAKMKEVGAVIGGEGNGGVIYPELHYGRDALVGVALFLTLLAGSGKKCSELKAAYPQYHISKNKIQLAPGTDVDALLKAVREKYADEEINDIDGVKIDFPEGWVHLRKSNTEPIVRVYSESGTREAAEALAARIMEDVAGLLC